MDLIRPSSLAAGLLMGLAAVAASVPHLSMAGGEGSLGVDLRVSAHVPPELALTGDDLMINARRLVPRTPHDGDRGSALLANQTGVALVVHVAALPSGPALADRLMLELSSEGRAFARGTLAQLHAARGGFVIPRGARRRLVVRAWLPATVRSGYQGVLQDVSLELRATPRTPTP